MPLHAAARALLSGEGEAARSGLRPAPPLLPAGPPGPAWPAARRGPRQRTILSIPRGPSEVRMASATALAASMFSSRTSFFLAFSLRAGGAGALRAAAGCTGRECTEFVHPARRRRESKLGWAAPPTGPLALRRRLLPSLCSRVAACAGAPQLPAARPRLLQVLRGPPRRRPLLLQALRFPPAPAPAPAAC